MTDDKYEMITNYTSFGFMGFLIFSNTRSFSLNVMNFLNILLGSLLVKIFPTDIVVYLLSEVI